MRKNKMELLVAERYKQFEAAYSNFKTRYSPKVKDGSTSPKADNVTPWTPSDSNRVPPPSRLT